MLSRALANRRLQPLGHPSTDEWGRHGVCPSGSSERPPPSQFGASQFAPPEQTGCYDRRHGMPNAPLLSQRTSDDDFGRLIDEIRACRLCAAELPLGPRPIVRGRPEARLLIISQAPGTRVHETGLSFDDRSGDRLRLWLGLDRETFYDESRVAIMGMGFCYPRSEERRVGKGCRTRGLAGHDRYSKT